MPSKRLSNSEFLGRVREYLAVENGIFETDERGDEARPVPLDELQENSFYLFDSDSILSFSHAIEDLAMEEAHGHLLAAMQDCDQFLQYRDRYGELAATLDGVQLIASGKMARRVKKLKFCPDAEGLVKRFWMVLFEGASLGVMFLCEQVNEAREFEQKKFVGFYTFSARLIAQARADMADALGGRCPELRQFSHLTKVDQATKRIKVEFAREKNAIEIAVRKLQSPEDKYDAKDFMADLNKTLERLSRLQTQLPELIVERQKK